jgi:hypothetical protein
VTFPAIKPSSRSYSPGQLPVRTYRTLSGAIWKRAFSNTRSGQALSLKFNSLNDGETEQIVAHFEDMGGTFKRFDLPSELFAGMSSGLTNRLKNAANIKWAYSSEPKVESVFPGYSDVTVELIGEVEYP